MESRFIDASMRAALRRYPFFSGRMRVVRQAPFRRLVPSEDVSLARLRDGGRLYVLGHDYVGRSIFLTGDYDPKITWLCKKVLRPGDTMLDVGANLGVVTANAARLVGPSGAVHAFEPQRDLAALIVKSMALNGYGQVVVHPYGLSDSDQESSLYGTPSNRGSASLGSAGPADELLGTVSIRRATDLLASLDLPRIRMLKLDIEGHEDAFLRGALPYLTGNPPDAIAFESHGSEPFQERPVVRMLAGLGYDFFQIPKPLMNMRLLPMTSRRHAQGFDFAALMPASGLARRWTR